MADDETFDEWCNRKYIHPRLRIIVVLPWHVYRIVLDLLNRKSDQK